MEEQERKRRKRERRRRKRDSIRRNEREGREERERGRETATVISRNFDGNREIALTHEEEGSETSRASKDPVILD